jgi:hypothetical protein
MTCYSQAQSPQILKNLTISHIEPTGNFLLIGSNIICSCINSAESGLFSICTNGSNYKSLISISNSSSIVAITNSDNIIYCLTSGNPQLDNIYPGWSATHGGSKSGILFSINSDGSNYKPLHLFDGNSNNGISENSINEGFIVTNGTIFGIAQTWKNTGIIFRISTKGTDYRVLYNYVGGSSGAYQNFNLRLIGDWLYVNLGMGSRGDNGNVATEANFFRIRTNGSDYKLICSSKNFPTFYSDVKSGSMTYCSILDQSALTPRVFSIDSTGKSITPIASNILGVLSVSNNLVSVNSSNSIVAIQTNGLNQRVLANFSANNIISPLATVGDKIYFVTKSSSVSSSSINNGNEDQQFICSININGLNLNIISSVAGAYNYFYLNPKNLNVFGYSYSLTTNFQSTNAILFSVPLPK